MAVHGTAENPLVGLPGNVGSEILDCPLHLPNLNALLRTIKESIIRARLIPYDLPSRKGELKGIVLMANEDASEIILRLVLRSTDSIHAINSQLEFVQAKHPSVKVITANILPRHIALVDGTEEIFLTSEKTIKVSYGDFSVFVGPQSFMQVSHSVASELYHYVCSLTKGEHKCSLLFDLFCGVGGFSFASARHSVKSIGVELSEDAILAANSARSINSAAQLTFIASDVDRFIRDYSGEKPEIIVMNPPRRGVSTGLISDINKFRCKKLIYSSCNPETFVRDSQLLSERYTLVSVKPFDMFPFTHHLEVVGEFAEKQ